MRIISGNYRGKKLVAPLDSDFRPTLDRVKQSIYDVIQFRVSGSTVLDLFAGSGALGIEALSRGAKYVAFNDLSKKSLQVVKSNLNNIKGDYEIFNLGFTEASSRLKSKSFDILFSDPPYAMPNAIKSLDVCLNLAADGAIIIYERLAENLSASDYFKCKSELLERVESITEKKYGTVAVDFILVKGDNK